MPHFPKITQFKYNCTHARVHNWHLIYKHMVNHFECLEGWFHLTFGISSFGYLTLHVKATEYSAIWWLWRWTMTRGAKGSGLQCSTNTQLVLALPVSHAALGKQHSQYDKSYNSEHFPLIFNAFKMWNVQICESQIKCMTEIIRTSAKPPVTGSHDSAYQNSVRFVLLWKLRT